MMLTMLPSLSLNQATLTLPTCATPFTVLRPISGTSYSSKVTPLARRSSTTVSNCSGGTPKPRVVFCGAGKPGRENLKQRFANPIGGRSYRLAGHGAQGPVDVRIAETIDVLR